MIPYVIHSFKYHNSRVGQITDFPLHFAEEETESLKRLNKLPKVKNPRSRALVESEKFGPRGCVPNHNTIQPLGAGCAFWDIPEDKFSHSRMEESLTKAQATHCGCIQGKAGEGREVGTPSQKEALGRVLRTRSD